MRAETVVSRAPTVAVIGAGPMGLACAHHLLERGAEVTVFEAGTQPGGMSVSIDFAGLRLERFYHYICRGDQPLFDLLAELGIADTLRWRETRMGYYVEQRLQDWGDPLALLRFPHLGPLQKLRYGLLVLLSLKRRDWRRLENVDAASWLQSWLGEKTWKLLWERLFLLKFHHFTGQLSAAWIWARLRRMGESRKNLWREQYGYLEGGSETLIERLLQVIRERGGEVLLGCPVREILLEQGRLKGLATARGERRFDAVISTVPLPYVPAMLPSLPAAQLQAYRELDNIACVCVILQLKKPLTRYFWLNICDQEMDIPGLVEYSNLRPLDTHIVYVPYYLPGDHPAYRDSDQVFLEKIRGYLLRLNPELRETDILDATVGRYRYAQPVCGPGFEARLPPLQTTIPGLLIADTSHYYPEDRSIAESVALGRRLAAELGFD